MNRDIIVVIGDLGPNWLIVDQEFNSCPTSILYYSGTTTILKDNRVPCDPSIIECVDALGNKTDGKVKRKPSP